MIVYVMISDYPSGGNKIIVEHVKRLSERGVDVAVSIIRSKTTNDWLELEGIKKIPFTKKALKNAEHVVATYWETYYYIEELCLKAKKYYFVQSKEEDFEKDWLRKQRVLNTLMNPKYCYFTEAKWIQDYLWNNFKTYSVLVENKIDLPKTLNYTKKNYILIEGEATSHNKNMVDGIRIAQKLGHKYSFHLLTNTPEQLLNPEITKHFQKIHALIKWEEALQIIAEAKILYRPSILEGFNGATSEAMLLETPTITNMIEGNEEMIINEYTGLLVKPYDILETSNAIKRLMEDEELRQKITKNALNYAKKNFTDWNKSIDILQYEIFNVIQ